ncbi:MAG: serine/threonine-protein kinase [Piscinibacter sp.]
MPPITSAPADWDKVRALFDAALGLDGAAREALLAQAGDEDAVIAEVRSLLAHAAATGDDFLARPAASALHADEPRRIGQRCGAWRITARIGGGGMGEVWRAERADGAFVGQAAIKLLKRGMDSDAVLARFALEQQALARLNHPHIAHLLDAGRSDDGLPFFVMELVAGRTIDQACTGLPLERRLALFLQLADAVAHAHRHLLLHRDLKPGNVLVSDDGQVKLLDFGIAKALDPLDVADAELTQAGPRPFTPQFASPEQVRGESVGTATDIYSLGVLLYVMLTGTRPYGRDARTPMQAARSVLEEEPTRPSALSPGLATDPQWPATRRRLQGDLDTILLKALDKRIEARYSSVEAMAADVRAHLAGRPVSARAPRAGYLAAKFVRRHRWAVTAGALALLALVGGLGSTLWQMQRAEQARLAAEQRFADVRRLANRLVFQYHDQIASLPGSTKVRAELLADAQAYLDDLLQHVGGDPALARELAETYFRLAVLQGESFSPSLERLDAAQANLDKAIALLPRYLDTPSVESAVLMNAADLWMAQSSLAVRRAKLPLARQALEQARTLAERARRRGPDDARMLSLLGTLEGRLGLLIGGSAASASFGRTDEAVPHLQAALAHLQALSLRDPANVEWMHELAWAHYIGALAANLRGEDAQAVALAERALQLRDQAARAAPDNAHLRHQTAIARLVLAVSLAHAGEHARAMPLMDEAQAIVRASVAADPSNQAAARDLRVSDFSRGRLLLLAGRDGEARTLLDQALAALPPVSLAEDYYVARARSDALVWAARAWRPADPKRALARADEAVAGVRFDGADGNASRLWTLAQAHGERAAALAALGRGTEAARAANQALAVWAEASPDGRVPGLFSRWLARDRALSRGAA